MSLLDGIRKNARTAKWVGILLIITGFLSVVAPMSAGISVTMIVGALLTIAGISQLLLAFRAGSFGEGLVVFLLGVLGLLAGLWMLFQPGIALASLTLLLAGYFVIAGIAQAFGAFDVKPDKGWGWLLFSGVVTVLLGVMIWSQFPFSGVWAVGTLVGIQLLMSGITLLTLGSSVGGAARTIQEKAGLD